MTVEFPIDGLLEVSFKNRFRLIGGIPGVTEHEYFIVVPSQKAEPFYWLLDEGDQRIFLLILDPQVVFQNYNPRINRADLQTAGINEEDYYLYCIVNFADPDNPTINLRSPIVLGKESHVGRQMILQDDQYDIRTPLLVHTEV